MVVRPSMSQALLCDFDDTIVVPDTGDVILEKFADGDWRTLSRLYNSNAMPIEEVMRRQLSMVKATKKSMIEELDRSVAFRPGFEELLERCDQGNIPFVVVSYGLDFCIAHMLKKARLSRTVEVHAPRTKLGRNGILFSFPGRRLKGSVNMKHDWVRRYKKMGRKEAFVGDGTSDYAALKAADLRFAIKGSALARLCDRSEIEHSQITSFDPVISAIR